MYFSTVFWSLVEIERVIILCPFSFQIFWKELKSLRRSFGERVKFHQTYLWYPRSRIQLKWFYHSRGFFVTFFLSCCRSWTWVRQREILWWLHNRIKRFPLSYPKLHLWAIWFQQISGSKSLQCSEQQGHSPQSPKLGSAKEEVEESHQ